MSTKDEKEAAKRVGDAALDAMKAAKDKVKGESGESTGSVKMDKLMTEVVDEHQEISLRIRRKDEKGRWESFSNLTGVNPIDFQMKGPEMICDEEGGKGEYEMTIVFPNGKTKQLPKVIRVGGTIQRPIAKSREGDLGGFGAGMPGMMGWPGMPGVGLPNANANNNNQGAWVAREINNANDKAFQMAGQQNNTMAQMMSMMMLGMTPMGQQMMGQNNSQAAQGDSAALAEIKELKQQRAEDQRRIEDQRRREEDRRRDEERRREDQRRTDERFNDLIRRLDDNKSSTELERIKLEHSQNKDSDSTWLKMMQLGREDARDSKKEWMLMLDKLTQTSPLSDEIAKMSMRQFEGTTQQLNIIAQIAQSGLLGGGESSPIKEAIATAIGEVAGGFGGYLENKGMSGGEEEEELPQVQVPPGQIESYPLQTEGVDLQQLEQGEPPAAEEPVEEAAPTMTAQEALLTDEELARFEKESALMAVIESLREGKPVHDAAARLFAHGEIHGQGWGSEVAMRWLTYPAPLSAQILGHFGLATRMLDLAENIMQFGEFLRAEGDPNEWSKETGYMPIKPPKKQKGAKPVAKSNLPGGPEFGVTNNGPPEDADEYDPSSLDGLSPEQLELAQKQRAERKEAAAEAQKAEEEEQRKLGINPEEAREAQQKQIAALAPVPDEEEAEEVPDEDV